jgi:primosomal protein N' (replication factor Y)
MPFVEVAVNSGLPHRQTFSYAVPDGMTLVPGDAVFVPFGRRFLQGIVMDVVEVPAFAGPKPVDARIGDAPVISAERVDLARWLADYYLAPLFASVALMLPPGFERRPLTFYEPLVSADELMTLKVPPRQLAVLHHLVEDGRSESKQVERNVKLSGVATALSQLSLRGLVRRSYGMARPTVRTKTVRYVYLTGATSQVESAIDSLASQRKGRLAKALRLLLDAGGSLPASELRLRAGATLPVLVPLAEDGLIEVRDEPVQRDPLAGRNYEPRPAYPLTPEQLTALAPVATALDSGGSRSFLLHGVTGSGKTEVYLAALQRAIDLGRRAIVLVPEIALTPQTVRRFAERFPGRVAVLHSGLSQGELYDQWYGIREGRYDVVIGSRSAIFAPQPDLGLIVIAGTVDDKQRTRAALSRPRGRRAAGQAHRRHAAPRLRHARRRQLPEGALGHPPPHRAARARPPRPRRHRQRRARRQL